MAAIATLGSMCAGHTGFNPRPTVEGESKFLVFGKPAHLTGGAWLLHILPSVPPQIHGGSGIGGSKFLVFGKPACMVGDSVTCTSVIITGESRFIIR